MQESFDARSLQRPRPGRAFLLAAKGVDSNDDIVPHTVTGQGFDSGSIDPGKSWTHTFAAKGKVAYKCSFHPTMAASVDVD